MIINFNNGSNENEYTPLLWECLGFRFRNDDLIYKLNCFNKRHNPMTKVVPGENFLYHLVFDDDNISSLILRVTSDEKSKFVDDVCPVSYSANIPKYNVKLENNAQKKYLFSFFDNRNGDFLFNSYVNLSSFQRDLNRLNIGLSEIKIGEDYILNCYIMSTFALIYNDESTLKEKVLNDNLQVFADFSKPLSQSETLTSIAGKIAFINVDFNLFTGLRFYEIGFVCRQNLFVVYIPSNYLNKFPKVNDYILISDFVVFGEIFSEKHPSTKQIPYIATSHYDKKIKSADNFILNLTMKYIKGYENVVKINKDEIFDGEIKIKYISIKLYNNVIKAVASLYVGEEKPISITINKDGDFESKINKLAKLKIKPNHDFVEDLIDGAYWYVIYNDIYLEGHDNLPEIIVKIKKILEFDKIIDVLKKSYLKYKEDENNDKN